MLCVPSSNDRYLDSGQVWEASPWNPATAGERENQRAGSGIFDEPQQCGGPHRRQPPGAGAVRPALIGELSTRSLHFRQDWADRDVHEHRTGRKVYRHPEVGELDITFDVFELPGEPGLSICTYSADEGSPSADKLALLATWPPPRSSRGSSTLSRRRVRNLGARVGIGAMARGRSRRAACA
ncbi:hypothetical protein [Georgenia sp. AZ-5]|uniref:MmyB family transcriptional regulator n=1 Tax=Georgenia sp. AZ-5 TaxID=3367526 RepID=UPI0037552F8C